MDADAARRARARTIRADLTQALTDEEACPPEWLDLLLEIDDRLGAVRQMTAAEAARFAAEPDIRVALRRREEVAARVRAEVAELRQRVKRLNLIAPHHAFQRTPPDADELVRPLFRVRRHLRPEDGGRGARSG